MIPITEEKGIPHHTQTAYQAGASCREVVQEVIESYIDSGANMFQCFYDLEKAFDSIEHNMCFSIIICTRKVSTESVGELLPLFIKRVLPVFAWGQDTLTDVPVIS